MVRTAEELDIRPALTGDIRTISSQISEKSEKGIVIIVPKATPETLDALGKSIDVFTHCFVENVKAQDQVLIEQIVSLFVPKAPVCANLMREAHMLAKAKKAVLESGDWVSAAEIAKLGEFTSNNPSSQPNKWKREKRIFAIRHNGSDYFPVYGLDKDAAFRPLPAMKNVITVLCSEKSGWGMAYWFASVNSYLGGKRPQDLISKDPQRVVAAAENEVAGITHG